MIIDYGDSLKSSYPLDPLAGEPIPMDLLADLSICSPYGKDVSLTRLVAGQGYVYVCFEASSGAPVAHLRIASPDELLIYPLDMDCAGSGRIVFGPGVLSKTPFSYLKDPVPVDPACLVRQQSGLKPAFKVNGFAYELPPVLNIRFRSGGKIASETVKLAGSSKQAITLRRDDGQFSESQLKRNFNVQPEQLPVSSLGGIKPDVSGNIAVSFELDQIVTGASVGLLPVKSGSKHIGLAFWTKGLAGCPNPYTTLTRNIAYSSCGTGSPVAMPLDASDLFDQTDPCPASECPTCRSAEVCSSGCVQTLSVQPTTQGATATNICWTYMVWTIVPGSDDVTISAEHFKGTLTGGKSVSFMAEPHETITLKGTGDLVTVSTTCPEV